jgi:undecaprenyl-diphosphatase
MNIFQAIILGIVQGLTEFLPVSSSGHLVLLQQLFGLKEAELFFDISVHMGTLVAVFIFFRKDIYDVILSVLRYVKMIFKTGSFSTGNEDPDLRLALLIITGSIPTALIGLLFHKIADRLFSSALIAGLMLILTGIVLFLTRFVKTPEKDISMFSIRDSFIIGISQGLAIMPGLSRSGTTIATGLFMGLKHETAARYSFLLSIPAILGASLLSFADLAEKAPVSVGISATGAFAAFVTGYFALSFLFYIVRRGRLHYFSPYCVIIGIFSLIIGL